jgi:hypothetical protein
MNQPSKHNDQARGPSRGVRFALAAVLCGAGAASDANAQDLLFTRDYGGSSPDGAYAIEATADGGFVASGFSESYSPNSSVALYLVKTDPEGQAEWSKTYELSTLETHGAAVCQLPDGGYAVAGRAGNNNAGFDSFLLRLDADGNEMWRRFYDAGDDDRAHGLAPTPDGGFILVGQAWFMNTLFGNYDLYVIKTDADGQVEWTRVYEYEPVDDNGHDIAHEVEPVSTGGYAIAGMSQSGLWAGWLLRIDDAGAPLWGHIYDSGWVSDELRSVAEVPGGGFALGAVYGNSNTGDVDMALIRTDDQGEPVWTRTFGFPDGGSHAECVRVMPDGGFVVAGMAASFSTSWDMYVVRTDAGGNLLWKQRHGGQGDDRAFSVAVGRDKIVAAGWAWSFGNGFGDLHLAAYSDPALGCTADFNADGQVNTLDVLAFLNAWAAREASADFNADGAINTLDVLAFLNAWSAGC